MTRLFIGHKPGAGPVVKIMDNDADNPLTTPNTDYGKFRFNSELPNVASCLGAMEVGPFPGIFMGVNGTVYKYLPEGSNIDTCHYAMSVFHLSGFSQHTLNVYAFPQRIFGLDYIPHVARALPDSGLLLGNRVYAFAGADYSGGWWRSYMAGSFIPVGSSPLNWSGPVPASPTACVLICSGAGSSAGAAESATGRMYAWSLPMDSSALPANGASDSGDLVVHFNEDVCRIARPGKTTASANADDYVISDLRGTMKALDYGVVTLASGGTHVVSLFDPLPSDFAIYASLEKPGEVAGLVPAYDPVDEGGSTPIATKRLQVSYAVNRTAKTFTLTNDETYSVKVKFMLFGGSVPSAPVGGGKVLRAEPGFSQLVVPGAGADPSFDDILVDSRWRNPPIIAEGWIPTAGFSVIPGGDPDYRLYGQKRASVGWTNTGTFEPLLMFFQEVSGHTYGGSAPYYLMANAVKHSPSIIGGATVPYLLARHGAVAKLAADGVKFFISPDGWPSLQYRQNDNSGLWSWQRTPTSGGAYVTGIRYYVFALPV